MASQDGTLDRIRKFAESNRKVEEERATHPIDHHAYNQLLDQTLKHLQDQVKRQEHALQELRRTTTNPLPQPPLAPRSRLAQTRRATKAYTSLSRTSPSLPTADSPLPTLLALRSTSTNLHELKTSVTAAASDLSTSRARLKAEESALRDARLIATGLTERIAHLQSSQRSGEGDGGREKAQSQLAEELIQQQRRRKEELQEKTATLRGALGRFVDEYLAAMLAAEGLGGPAVGDRVEVGDEVLEAGFTAQGKERRAKVGRDSGQQRIDELVRRRSREGGDGDGGGSGSGRGNKRETAGEEMHDLLDALLEAAGTSAYIELERDTAASRFLVKAKIAQFHPRDARRLRLIDFARELAD
ncbi:hypothetical protein AJ79_06533 [Helicocarpus griseus UAMH5409]|uniref:Uncharacterized protein n=1 Tax=Helicocarpus griseus UAMH5409 TaxID=1447875 RepID=A0A2B7XCH7_9EURO|nr:hypothetical protein AJ79_06533 [Helicocarpus griseus UAMH5409]